MSPVDYEKELKQRDETIARLKAEISELKKLLADKAEAKAAKKPKFTENYSLGKNAREKKRRKKSTGRRRNDTKRAMVEHEYDIYWNDADRQQCIFHREQFAWRIANGKAVYVGYRIHDLPGSKELPLPTGLRNSRSEFGIEIILTLAFLHYWIGVSLDNAREIMRFFSGLELSKSQADSLLNQLAADWDEQYDAIAEIIALSMIVYIDETGWKVGKRSCYTWAFSTAKPSLRMSRQTPRQRSSGCKMSWSITLTACLCSLSIRKSSLPTIVASVTSAAKRKYARAVVPASRTAEPNDAA